MGMKTNGEGLKLINKFPEEYWLCDVEEAEKAVWDLVELELKENEFSALVSFVVSIGIGRFKNSLVLKRINQGLILEAADEILQWTFNGKEEDRGYAKRRKQERALFLRPEIVGGKHDQAVKQR